MSPVYRLTLLLLSLFCFTASFANTKHQIVIGKPVTNMFAKNSTDSAVVSQAIYNTPITIIKTKGRWEYIQTPDHYRGWIPESVTLRIKKHKTQTLLMTNQLMVHIYKDPDTTTHQPIITLP